MEKKIVCIIQARMTSTRLPKKVLLPLCNKPVIDHVFHQLSFSKRINQIVLATSTDISDDLLKEWAEKNNKDYFRGSLDNVLERYYFAAKKYHGDIIVRITADCPLIDPTVVDLIIEYFLNGHYDYFSNTILPTFPDGLDTEVFTFSALEKTFKEAKWKSEIEHVTPYIKNNTKIFKTGNFRNDINYEQLRWTIDNKDDYEFLKIIFNNLYNKEKFICWKDVIAFIKANPDVQKINEHLKRDEGFSKSLKEDHLI